MTQYERHVWASSSGSLFINIPAELIDWKIGKAKVWKIPGTDVVAIRMEDA